MSAKKKSVQTRGDEPKFEEALAELEDVVRRLEEGDIALEESLSAFERGVALVRLLHARLDAVQTRVEELTRSERGDLVIESIDDE